MLQMSNLIKVIAAFVAGIVVAIGSALIYVRATEMVHPQPIELTTPSLQQPAQPQQMEPKTPTAVTQAANPEPTPEPVHKARPTTHKLAKAASREPSPTPPTVEVAQNSPPAAQAPALPAAPVIDDSAQAPAAPAPQPLPDTNSAPPPEPARQPHVVTLQPGTSLVVRLGETLSTEHNYTGDTFRATLESPIVMDGFVIADKGSKVLGRIVNAQKSGRIQGVSDLNLTLTEINTTDGQRIRVESSSYDKRGPTSAGEDTAKIAGGAALGAIIGAIAGGGKGAAIGAGAGGAAGTGTVLATRGKAAVLPTETRLTFHLANPVTITERLN